MNFLRDFHLADTPGMNSLEPGHNAAVEAFLPRADLVFFILPVTNPWGAAPWEFLERIQRRGLQRVVLILQQSDLREDAEVATVLTHLRQVARQRLGGRAARLRGFREEGVAREDHRPRQGAPVGGLRLRPARGVDQPLPRRRPPAHREAPTARRSPLSLNCAASPSARAPPIACSPTTAGASSPWPRGCRSSSRSSSMPSRASTSISTARWPAAGSAASKLLGERLRPWRALRASLGGDDRRWIERFRASLERACVLLSPARSSARCTACRPRCWPREKPCAASSTNGPSRPAAPRREAHADRASEDWLLQRRGRIRALDEDAARHLSGPALAKDLRDLFLEAAGELLTHGPALFCIAGRTPPKISPPRFRVASPISPSTAPWLECRRFPAALAWARRWSGVRACWTPTTWRCPAAAPPSRARSAPCSSD